LPLVGDQARFHLHHHWPPVVSAQAHWALFRDCLPALTLLHILLHTCTICEHDSIQKVPRYRVFGSLSKQPEIGWILIDSFVTLYDGYSIIDILDEGESGFLMVVAQSVFWPVARNLLVWVLAR